MSAIRTLRCRTVAQGQFRNLAYVRDLPALTFDEPSAIQGPAPSLQPLELLLAALGSCLAIHIRADAVARGIELSDLALDLEGDVAAAPLEGEYPEPMGLASIRATVHLTAAAPWEALERLVARATLRSPVANTLHDGTAVAVSLAAAPVG